MIDHSKLPAKVSEVADQVGLSTSTIRRYIERGFLQAETPEGGGPLVVVGGELPVDSKRWRSAVAALMCETPKGLWGFGANDRVEILRDGRRFFVDMTDSASKLREIVASGDLMQFSTAEDNKLTV